MIIDIPQLRAGADLSANQFRAVKMDTGNDNKVVAITANTDRPIGIQLDDPNADGDPIEVAGPGSVCKAKYGGTVVRGDVLGVQSDGDLETETAVVDGSAVDRYTIAIALESGASGEIHPVLVTSPLLIAKA